jgi:hypothetical protein
MAGSSMACKGSGVQIPSAPLFPTSRSCRSAGVASEQRLLRWSDPEGHVSANPLTTRTLVASQTVALVALTVVVFARGLRGLAVDVTVADGYACRASSAQISGWPFSSGAPYVTALAGAANASAAITATPTSRSRRIRGFPSSTFKISLLTAYALDGRHVHARHRRRAGRVRACSDVASEDGC